MRMVPLWMSRDVGGDVCLWAWKRPELDDDGEWLTDRGINHLATLPRNSHPDIAPGTCHRVALVLDPAAEEEAR